MRCSICAAKATNCRNTCSARRKPPAGHKILWVPGPGRILQGEGAIQAGLPRGPSHRTYQKASSGHQFARSGAATEQLGACADNERRSAGAIEIVLDWPRFEAQCRASRPARTRTWSKFRAAPSYDRPFQASAPRREHLVGRPWGTWYTSRCWALQTLTTH